MKNFPIILFILVITLASCHKEYTPAISTTNDIDTFNILPSSRSVLLPYLGKNSVIFEDSHGVQRVFKIMTFFHSTTKNSHWDYDVNVLGDTIRYDYISIGDILSLIDDSGQYVLSLRVYPRLSIPNYNTDSIKVFDTLHIMVDQAPNNPGLYSAFYKIVDSRDIPPNTIDWPNNVLEPSRTFLGITFSDVEHTNFNDPKAIVYFNQTYGIVAFTDYDHKLWRLKI